MEWVWTLSDPKLSTLAAHSNSIVKLVLELRSPLSLPLTMAILPSLLTVIDEDVFAIPMESVSEIVSIGASDITTIHGMKTATVRGRAISVVDLGGLFNWNIGSAEKQSANEEHTLVIIGSDGNELGLSR